MFGSLTRETHKTTSLPPSPSAKESLLSFSFNEANVLARSPWQSYGLAALPSLIALLSLIFFGSLRAFEGMPASPTIATLVLSNPRLSVQVVAILASFLTASVKWGFSRAIVFTAQKRFLKFHPVFEAEVYSSLKNGGILWTSWSQDGSRWFITGTTTIAVVLCGLLTSGFVSLLSPLPIRVMKEVSIDGNPEARGSCGTWLNDTWNAVQNQSCETWLDYNGFAYQQCGIWHQLLDGVEAGKGAMLAHVRDQRGKNDSQQYMTTYTRLGGARILGSTGGIVPLGPSGIAPFSRFQTNVGADTNEVNSQPTDSIRYSLIQQGVWVNVSCQYVDPSALPYQWPMDKKPPTPVPSHAKVRQTQYRDNNTIVYVSSIRDPSPNATTIESNVVWSDENAYILKTSCPGVGVINRTISKSDNLLAFDSCKDPNSDTWSIYLQSALKFDALQAKTFNVAYAGIGSMNCTVTAQLRNVKSTFDPKIGGFIMEPDEKDPGIMNPGNPEVFSAVRDTILAIQASQIPNRNMFAMTVDNIAVSHYGLPGGVKDERYPPLVASMIKGMVEYAATLSQLVETLSNVTAPQGCRTTVNGTAEYSVIGWNAQTSTFIALLPLIFLTFVFLVLIVLAILGEAHPETKLNLFDPTSPVSLIAASSAGGVQFDSGAVGDPEDEVVRAKYVKYGEISKAGRWGLVEKSST